MITFKNLTEVRLEKLNEAFNDAFSDYQVEMNFPINNFRKMLQRQGYHSEISMGAFEDDKLVGFILNGLREWNGKKTVYDLGTGAIREFRRQGITSEMLLNLKKMLKAQQVEQYLLEVITSNQSAFELYKKQGFEIQREFVCFQLERDKFIPKEAWKVEVIENLELEKYQDFWDFKPSWQNSIESVSTLPDAFYNFVVRQNDDIIGYGLVNKNSGDIPQIAVHKNHRGKGIAGSIITEMIKNTACPKLSIINVEANLKHIEEFFLGVGFTSHIGQYEMLLQL